MLDQRSKSLRKLVIKMVSVGRRGHIGPALSLIEILRVLYDSVLNYNSKQPNWNDRDRFILSKGHGCLALYAILADKKFFKMEELDNFCEPKSILGGHPERDKIPGVEASTGALGHGMSIAVGIALAAKIKNKGYKTFVVTGDGEINEGSVWEAAMSASKHKLNNLCVLVDHNKLQSYGHVKEVLDMGNLSNKWKSFGFTVQEVDGHDVLQLIKSLNNLSDKMPNAIICHTIKGKGLPFAENNPKWHHKAKLTDDDLKMINNYFD